MEIRKNFRWIESDVYKRTTTRIVRCGESWEQCGYSFLNSRDLSSKGTMDGYYREWNRDNASINTKDMRN